MYINNINLINFRNYQEEKVSFHRKTNIITGKNAQGKTNLLESLYIMSLGKSFRTNKDREMIGFSGNSCTAKCAYTKEDRESTIEITISEEGKKIFLDNIPAGKTSELLEHVYTVIFSPEDLKIIKDEPEKRRRFIDRELCQIRPVYYRNLGAYKKVLQQRNALLKKENPDEEMLSVWDKVLVEYGTKIIRERKQFLETLCRLSRDYHHRISDGKEELSLYYESDIVETAGEAEISECFSEALKKQRKTDLFRGTTGAGPHKDDIKICINDVDARHYGSQGQQRTAALSMKLAEIKLIKEEKQEDAILLLDDVLSELDITRQKFLFDALSDAQLFITVADLSDSLLDHMAQGAIFRVEKGHVGKG